MPASSSSTAAASHEELFERYRTQQDLRAFEALFDALTPRLLAFVARMLRGSPSSTSGRAEELVQETWVRACRSAGTFRGGSRFSTWLFSIAWRLCVDQLGRKAEVLRAEEEAPPDADVALGESAWLEPKMADPSLQQLLLEAVETLSVEQREIILLRFQGLSLSEIAQINGVNLQTLKARAFKGRLRVARYLREHGVDLDDVRKA
ncbi:MAG: RNA polymerase sigma factor [Myxococcales bacterium]